MVAARDSDFFGEGTADQGQAKPLSLYEQNQREADARARKAAEDKAKRLAGQSDKPIGAQTQRSAGFDAGLGRYRTADDLKQRPEGTGFVDSVVPTLEAISKDPVTAGILLAPYGIAGAGLAIGGPQALGFAQGTGSIAGATPGIAVKDTIAPALTRVPTAMPGGIGTPGAGAGATTGAAGGGGSAAATGGTAAAAGWGVKDTVGVAAGLGLPLAKLGLEEIIRGGGGDEAKKLREKQEQIARETQLRRQQMQTARMDALGARMVAFDPYNQYLARTFGPEAAFQPEALAGMAENPMKPQLDPALKGYDGTDQSKLRQVRDYNAATHKYAADEEARRNRVMGGVQRPGPGPAPLTMPAPQAARRY
jgi:hypothetical protein